METRYQLPILPEFSSQQVEPACCFHLLLLLGHFFRLAGYPLRSDVIYSSLWTKRWEGEGGESKVKANSRCGQKTTRNIILGLCPALWTFLQVVILFFLMKSKRFAEHQNLQIFTNFAGQIKDLFVFFLTSPHSFFCSTPPSLSSDISSYFFFLFPVVIKKEIKISLE